SFLNPLRRPVELPVDTRIAQNSLHVFAGFGEGDGLDELLRIAVMTLSQPVAHAVRAGVVRGQGVFELAVVLVNHIFEVTRAEFYVYGGREKLRRAVSLELDLFGYGLPCFWQKLHQAYGVGAGERQRIEFGLLPDQRRDQIGIEAVELRIFA